MSEPIFLLGSQADAARIGPAIQAVTSAEDFRAALRHRRARWFAFRENVLSGLLGQMVEPSDTWHRILLLQRPSAGRQEVLRALFRVVVTPNDTMKLLAAEDLQEVLKSEHAEDYFIGGMVDRDDNMLVLYRGDLDRLLVPLDFFMKKDQAVKPDFADFDITDVGQTLRFGDYEAASSAVLYEFDAAARKRMRERERDQDATFGGALKRLRLSKGVSRGDFPGLDAKTVARIERNEVQAPHGDTLGILAKRLRVKPEAIKTY